MILFLKRLCTPNHLKLFAEFVKRILFSNISKVQSAKNILFSQEQSFVILTSSTIDKKLEIDKNLEIELEIDKNLEIELEIYKNLESFESIFEFFVNFESIFKVLL